MKYRNHSIHKFFIGIVWIVLLCSSLLSGTFVSFLYYIRFFAGMKPFLLPMMTMAFCLFIGSILSLPSARFFIKPLKELVNANKQVAAGHFDVKVDEKIPNGEMRELMVSFNHMTQELSNMEIFRNDFINNFSHEFKTPIVSIRGFAHQLLYDDGLTEEQKKEYIAIIASESDRLANMSSNVLLLTKLEHQEIITDISEFYLDEQIRHAILLLEKEWDQKQILLDIDLEEIRYKTNEELLSHVWINLISNAIKFTPEGGTIRVHSQKLEDHVLVTVSDTGIGMDQDAISHIFDKFYQADRSHTTAGNGLGLSLVKRIVELLHGEISVRSIKGEGSEFLVRLPLT